MQEELSQQPCRGAALPVRFCDTLALRFLMVGFYLMMLFTISLYVPVEATEEVWGHGGSLLFLFLLAAPAFSHLYDFSRRRKEQQSAPALPASRGLGAGWQVLFWVLLLAGSCFVGWASYGGVRHTPGLPLLAMACWYLAVKAYGQALRKSAGSSQQQVLPRRGPALVLALWKQRQCAGNLLPRAQRIFWDLLSGVCFLLFLAAIFRHLTAGPSPWLLSTGLLAWTSAWAGKLWAELRAGCRAKADYPVLALVSILCLYLLPLHLISSFYEDVPASLQDNLLHLPISLGCLVLFPRWMYFLLGLGPRKLPDMVALHRSMH